MKPKTQIFKLMETETQIFELDKNTSNNIDIILANLKNKIGRKITKKEFFTQAIKEKIGKGIKNLQDDFSL